jgi:hypothetical protein
VLRAAPRGVRVHGRHISSRNLCNHACGRELALGTAVGLRPLSRRQ